MNLAWWAAASYLLGAIPTSYLVARLAKGIDLRQVGSKNLGATNLYRALGWRYAIPVFLVDVAKGAIPVAVFGPRAGGGLAVSIGLGAIAVVGHVFSVFVGFKGGKGVATGAGLVFGVAPWAALIALLLWIAVVKLSGYVSLASILAALTLPVSVYLLHPALRAIWWVFALLALFVVVTHRANIQRLVAGTEHRFGRRASGSP